MRKVGDLSQLHDKFFDRGFRVVGVSGEPKDKLQSIVVDQLGGTFWIGADGQRETQREYIQEGRIGIPRFYLVDARGVVVHSQMPSEDEIRDLLDGAFDVGLGKDLHEELSQAVTAYEGEAYGVAFRMAKGLAGSEDAAVAADARFLVEKIEALVEFRQSTEPLDIADMREESRYGRLLVLARMYSGLPLSDWAVEQRKKLEGRERIKKARKAWRDLAKALDREFQIWERPVKRWEYERRRAADGYTKLKKKHGGLVGRIAMERHKALSAR